MSYIHSEYQRSVIAKSFLSLEKFYHNYSARPSFKESIDKTKIKTRTDLIFINGGRFVISWTPT